MTTADLAGIVFVERTPTLAEFRLLCDTVNWTPAINFDVAERGLRNSLYGVTVLHHGQPVGMGRIVGDSAIYFYLQDVIVHPEHQGKGIGRLIMEMLLAYLADHAPDHAFIGLFANDGKQPFYSRFGFIQHPALTGMFCIAPLDTNEFEYK